MRLQGYTLGSSEGRGPCHSESGSLAPGQAGRQPEHGHRDGHGAEPETEPELGRGASQCDSDPLEHSFWQIASARLRVQLYNDLKRKSFVGLGEVLNRATKRRKRTRIFCAYMNSLEPEEIR